MWLGEVGGSLEDYCAEGKKQGKGGRETGREGEGEAWKGVGGATALQPSAVLGRWGVGPCFGADVLALSNRPMGGEGRPPGPRQGQSEGECGST